MKTMYQTLAGTLRFNRLPAELVFGLVLGALLFSTPRAVHGAAPRILSVTPLEGEVDSSVTLVGSNFSDDLRSNTVYFGAVRSTVSAASRDSLVVNVPAGATCDPITVTVTGLTAYAASPFRVLFPSSRLLEPTTFGLPVDLPATDGTAGIALADLDQDGRPDLLVSSASSALLQVYRNLSHGGALVSTSFAARVEFPIGGAPAPALAVGDADGDGLLDVITVNLGAATVSVLRNRGVSGAINSGSLAAKVDFACGPVPVHVEIQDLDGDGKPEIITANNASGSISILQNKSDRGSVTAASFAPKVDITTGTGTRCVRVADVDGDGKPDLIVGHHGSGVVSVFRNVSVPGSPVSSWFEPQVNFPSGDAYSVTVADLDGDGRPDLVLDGRDATVGVLRNQSVPGSIASYSFTTKVNYEVLSEASYVTVIDFDGDGKLDLVAALLGHIYVSMLRNTSVPGILDANSFAGHVDFRCSADPRRLAVGDLNADGKPEVVCPGLAAASVSLLQNQVAPPGPPQIVRQPQGLNVAAGSDVTLSAEAVGGGLKYQWRRNDIDLFDVAGLSGTHTATLTVLNIQPSAAGVYSLVIRNDLGQVTTTGATVGVIAAPPVPVVISLSPAAAEVGALVTIVGSNFAVTPADNIVYFGPVRAQVMSAGPESLSVRVPSGPGCTRVTVTVAGRTGSSVLPFCPTFSSSQLFEESSFAPKVALIGGSENGTVAVGDFDGDGRVDIAATSSSGSSVSIYRNVHAGGNLTPQSFATRVTFPVAPGPSGVVVADLDGDGRLDIATFSVNSQSLSLLRNRAVAGSLTAASFAPYEMVPCGAYPTGLACEDLDGDGRPEMIVANGSESSFTVFRNIGMPGTLTPSSFAGRVDVLTSPFPAALAVTDVDGDRKSEVVLSHTTGDFLPRSLSVFQNRSLLGAGTRDWFSAQVLFPGGNSFSVTAGDVNGDGKPELLVAARDATAQVLRNRSVPGSITPSSFAEPLSVGPAGQHYAVLVNDLDGDGKLDLIACSVNSPLVSVLRNTSTAGPVDEISFAPQADYDAGPNPAVPAIADLNGDGKPDLISRAYVLQNNMPRSGPPQIISPLQNQTVTVGADVTWSVVATGPRLRYQWRRDGVNLVDHGSISGASTPSLLLQNVQEIQSGKYSVLVSNPYGEISSGDITLLVTAGPKIPVITRIEPPIGPVGTVVRIEGRNFGTSPAENAVFFGPVRGQVTTASANVLEARVPPGATYAPITVTVGGRTGWSGTSYRVTFASAQSISPNSFAPQFNLATPAAPVLAALGDFDNDGRADIVTGNAATSTLLVRRNISTPGVLNAQSFSGNASPFVGLRPVGLAVCDLDGDGFPDIVSANDGSATLSLLRNRVQAAPIATTSFGTKVDLAAGESPQSVAAQDLDGDGRPDLVCANYVDNTLSVFRNKGAPGNITSQSFAPKIDLPTARGPRDVVVADVDGDGQPDLVVSHFGGGVLSVFRNVSVPGGLAADWFAPRVDFAVGDAYTVAVGDLDGDNRLDMVFDGRTPTVGVMLNTSTPGRIDATSFSEPRRFQTAAEGFGVALGDLDGDGKLDLLSGNLTFGHLSVLRNTCRRGVLEASSFASYVDFVTGIAPRYLTIGDLDGDAQPDILIPDGAQSSLAILRNTAPPPGPPRIVTQPVGVNTTVFQNSVLSVGALGPDLHFQWRHQGANLMDGNGVTGATSALLQLNPVRLEMAGAYDVVVSNSVGSVTSLTALVQVRLAPPTITGLEPPSGRVGTTVRIRGNNFSPVAGENIVYFGGVRAMVTGASLEALEVVVPPGATHAAVTLTVEGRTGSSPAPFQLTFPSSESIGPASLAPAFTLPSASVTLAVASADLDGDGLPDVIIGNQAANQLTIYRNLGTPGPLTRSSFDQPLELFGGNSRAGLAVADIDGDGRLDIIAGHEANSAVVIFRNQSTRPGLDASSFASPVELPSGPGPLCLAVQDLDGDGRPDIVAASLTAGGISIHSNRGQRGMLSPSSFAPRAELPTASGPHGVATADLDGDHRPEIIVCHYGSGLLSIFQNASSSESEPSQWFRPRVDFSTGDANSVAVGDIDGDGKPDVVLDVPGGATGVFRNTTVPGLIDSGSFAPRTVFAVAGDSYGSVLGDLDGDGRLDVVAGSMNNGRLSVLRNTSMPGTINAASLSPKTDFVAGGSPRLLAVADLNLDGKPEVLVADLAASSISILPNSVGPPIPPGLTTEPQDVTTIAGSDIQLQVLAAGPGLAFLWRHAGTNLVDNAHFSGAASPLLKVTDIPLELGGAYVVVVSNRFGSITSRTANVTVNLPSPIPVITSLAPSVGLVGRSIQIFGRNFHSLPERNVVYFGPVQGRVTAASPGELTVTVPSGATYAPLTVMVDGRTAWSPTRFTPIFASAQVLEGNSFAAPLDLPTPGPTYGVALGDFDGDGHPDIVVARHVASSILVYRNLASTNPLSPQSFASPIEFPVEIFPRSVTVADVDSDGHLDLVVANEPSASVSVLRNLGNPGLTTTSFAPAVNFATGARPNFIAVQDMDGDGRPEILTANYGAQTVSILQNRTRPGEIVATSFARQVGFLSGITTSHITVGDVDGDGRPDVIVAHVDDPTVSVFPNLATPDTPAAQWLGPRLDFAAGGSSTVEFADLDGDGRGDIVVGSGTASVVVLPNRGIPGPLNPNSFAPRIEVPLAGDINGAATADLDGDGRPDVVAGFLSLPTLALLQNVSSPGGLDTNSFLPAVLLPAGVTPRLLAIGDLDGDGRPDLVMPDPVGARVRIFRNTVAPPLPPTIRSQPQAQASALGGTANFTVSAAGVYLTYQWLKDGIELPGAVAASLLVTNVQPADGGHYSVRVSSGSVSVMSVDALLTVLEPPQITSQPQSQTVGLGRAATFTVSVVGSSPLSFLWFKDGALLSTSPSPSFFILAVAASDAGAYRVVVSNELGSVTSAEAELRVLTSTLHAPDAMTQSGATFEVPIRLSAVGDENALGFSLRFNPAKLAFRSIVNDATNAGATFVANTQLRQSGHVGVVLALPMPDSFRPGTQLVARVTFVAVTTADGTSTLLDFDDTPTVRQVVNTQAALLPANYSSGKITIRPTPYEGDVSPRPDGGSRVTVADMVQVGRFVAGLDPVANSNEFQRADCGPRDTRGNGRLSVSDWVQAGRYAAGRDGLVLAGGPTEPEQAPGAGFIPAGGTPTVSLFVTNVLAGEEVTVRVLLDGQGIESGVAFTLKFDPTKLRFRSLTPLARIGGGTLLVNTNTAHEGVIGVVMAMPSDQTILADSDPLMLLSFFAAHAASATSLTFSDQPVWREIVDQQATALPAVFRDAQLSVNVFADASLKVARTADLVALSWPASTRVYELHSATTLENPNWRPVTSSPVLVQERWSISIPLTNSQQYFRLVLRAP